MIINELKDVWYNLKIWKKILTIIVLCITLVIFILVTFNIIKPVLILWAGFIIVIIILMILGKRGINF